MTAAEMNELLGMLRVLATAQSRIDWSFTATTNDIRRTEG
jgi:hypothetical protein